MQTCKYKSKQMKKIYISGKVTGMEEKAKFLFKEAEKDLIKRDYTVVNPMELNHSGHDKSWQNYMRLDIKALCDCDAIYMLTNWRDSEGAKVELAVANHLELDVMHQHRMMKEETEASVGIIEISKGVKEIISMVSGFPTSEMKYGTTLSDEVGLDSLDHVVVIMDIEQVFNLHAMIDDEKAGNLRTVGEFVDLVVETLKNK